MLIIEDPNLINALLKALCVVKFDVPVEDEAAIVAGSPLVAQVCNLTYEALIAAEHKRGRHDSARILEEGRTCQNTLALSQVYHHIKFVQQHWEKWTHEQKAEHVRTILSPFVATQEIIDSVISTADIETP